MLKLLEQLDCKVQQEGHVVRIDASQITSTQATYDLVKTMRASILVLCPLVARFGKAKVSLPGGMLPLVPVLWINISKALKHSGQPLNWITVMFLATCPKLKGCRIVTDMVTVTGTENLLMAAVLAEGQTIIENAAREPEVVDLANCLIAMGAKISGAGTTTIVVEGVDKLHGTTYQVMPDRIEAGSFLVGAVATGGDVTVTDCAPNTFNAVIEKLVEAGAEITIGEDWVRARAKADRKPWISVRCRTLVFQPICRLSSWR